MRNTKKILLVVFIGCFILLGNMGLSAAVWYSGTELTINSRDWMGGVDNKKPRELIIEGASHFLKAYSSYLMVLNTVESAESDYMNLDCKELEKNLKLSFDNIKKTLKKCSELNDIVETSGLNKKVVAALKKFKYKTFSKKYNLIKPMFDEVREFLKKGNLRQLYKRMLTDCTDIHDDLEAMLEKVKANADLEAEMLWALNESFSYKLLFGQYVARVFGNIDDKLN